MQLRASETSCNGGAERFIYLILQLYQPLTTVLCHLASGLGQRKKWSSYFLLKVFPHSTYCSLFANITAHLQFTEEIDFKIRAMKRTELSPTPSCCIYSLIKSSVHAYSPTKENSVCNCIKQVHFDVNCYSCLVDFTCQKTRQMQIYMESTSPLIVFFKSHSKLIQPMTSSQNDQQ